MTKAEPIDQRPSYSARLTGGGGSMRTRVDLMVGAEHEAMAQARALAGSYDVELFDGKRLIVRIPVRQAP